VNFEPEKYKANIAVIDNYMEEIRNELIQLDRPDPILAVSNYSVGVLEACQL
jgi:hypothetical protein